MVDASSLVQDLHVTPTGHATATATVLEKNGHALGRLAQSDFQGISWRAKAVFLL